MVRFNKKESEARKELLASMNQMNDGKENENAAFQHVRENISDLEGTANETDLVFLQGLLDNPAVKQLIKIQDKFEESPEPLKPVRLGNLRVVKELEDRLSIARNPQARELFRIIRNPHFKSLIHSHDQAGDIVYRKLKNPGKYDKNIKDETDGNTMPVGEAIKMVGIRKNPNEPLGLTVEVDDYKQVVVARILAGGMIDRQGLLNPGDVILEVNGVAVHSPEELQSEISRAKESVTLKIGPNVDEEMKSARLTSSNGAQVKSKTQEAGKKLARYMRALFDYDPTNDELLPCKQIGLSFLNGDILQIISIKDPNWWQAKHAGTEGPIGLIPSQELEERRKAYVPPEADFVHKIGICGTRISKRKIKTFYQSKANCDFDKADTTLYEEVTRMPPFKRKTLVLIGAQGYWFADREDMEEEIHLNNFLEYGEHNGNLYGTHLDSIRNVIKEGKMCVLDCAPSALKLLHNSPEFMPFVIFIAAPGMEQLKLLYAERRAAGGSQRNLAFDRQSSIRYSSRRARTLESLASLYEDDELVNQVEESAMLQRKYEKYLDMVIVNEDFDQTFRQVLDALDVLSHEHQMDANDKNRTKQCNPTHKPSGPGHNAGYDGPRDKHVMDNKANMGQPTHPSNAGKK
ncbi:CLUMA_CG001283, isoform A [Clunio marinus]|uniref:CLUMA_CG001283, isoform A n=1 Tax=Clunio marinus TaxID=568069 RepID=A0A1J1HIU7_9DIPT|nr:CLUMA_CG001283, isoform A [Clunio marinus]